MNEDTAHGLFEVAGIGLEYMVVERGSLRVSPSVDLLFQEVAGGPVGRVERGELVWEHGLAAHVLRVGTARPVRDLPALREALVAEVRAINELLGRRDLELLPTGAHPFFDPFSDTVLWPHEPRAVYDLCNRIFDCRHHGWSNVLGVRLDLPFANDIEFGKLHTAVRMVLAIIPALSASSPILEGQPFGYMDARLEAHLHHRERLPELTGSLIPEAVLTEEEYYREIYGPIGKALGPYDEDGILDHHFANARGAVAHFDEGTIGIHVIDVQECPSADLAIAELVVETVKALVEQRWMSNYLQRAWHHHDLLAIFEDVIRHACNAKLHNPDFLLMFGMDGDEATANALWRHIFEEVKDGMSAAGQAGIRHILEHGCLASRILKKTGLVPEEEGIMAVYRELAECLRQDRQLL